MNGQYAVRAPQAYAEPYWLEGAAAHAALSRHLPSTGWRRATTPVRTREYLLDRPRRHFATARRLSCVLSQLKVIRWSQVPFRENTRAHRHGARLGARLVSAHVRRLACCMDGSDNGGMGRLRLAVPGGAVGVPDFGPS